MKVAVCRVMDANGRSAGARTATALWNGRARWGWPIGLAAVVASVLAAVLALGGCAGSQDSATAEQKAADRALLLGARDVAEVERADLAAGVPVSGTLRPATDIHITAPAPDQLDQVLVKEGQAVKRGQVLARFRLVVLEPEAASARAQLRITESDYRRMQNLHREGAVSARDVENAEAAWRAAEAAAAAATKRLQEAIVRAPASGVIAERRVQSGDRVGDGDPLFRLVDTAELEFEATVPSASAGRVKPGAAVELEVAGLAETRIAGRVARVNATADPATRQVKVYVTVPNRDGRLVGDLFASGRVVLESASDALAIPAGALRADGQGKSYVWVVAGGRLARRDVEAGVRDEGRERIEIRRGLEGGETVVVGPIEGLRESLAVELPAGS
jgi:RND family efflux transporter MFP subunit